MGEKEKVDMHTQEAGNQAEGEEEEKIPTGGNQKIQKGEGRRRLRLNLSLQR